MAELLLPRRPEARTEIGLHVVREAIWAALVAPFAARGCGRGLVVPRFPGVAPAAPC